MKHRRLSRPAALVLAAALLLTVPGAALAAPAALPDAAAPAPSAPEAESAALPAAEAGALDIRQVESIPASLLRGEAVEEGEPLLPHADTDMVRAIVTLDAPPVAEQLDLGGAAAQVFSAGSPVRAAQDRLLAAQDRVTAAISREVLGGEPADVVWNLTLLTNSFSVNIPYGKLAAVGALEGVKSVSLAMRYAPADSQVANIAAKDMTGVNAIQRSPDFGYTGAGMRIAVLDTGTDLDHQSFDNASYLYSLRQNVPEGEGEADYLASLDLLDEAELAGLLPRLHAATQYDATLTARDLFFSDKLPFIYNYVDKSLDVTHDAPGDASGEHGSHVAGIAAANRYIDYTSTLAPYDFTGDGATDLADVRALMSHLIRGAAVKANAGNLDVDRDGAVTTHDATALLDRVRDRGTDTVAPAAEKVGVEGVAPDAQLITMKVFGVNGGAYDDDLCAAMEDALVLGCQVINMSLGGAWAGFSDFYGYPIITESTEESEANARFMEKVMTALDRTDVVVAIAAGNNGNWADNDSAYQLMYTDEGGTAVTSTPSSYRSPLSVASADNVGYINSIANRFSNAAGSAQLRADPTEGTVTAGEYPAESWRSLGTDEGETYDVVFLGDPTGLLTGGTQRDNSIYGGASGDYRDVAGKIVLVARGGQADLNGDGDIGDDERFTFARKHSLAGAAGARAILIYNNAPGVLGPVLDGTTAAIPCGCVTLDQAKAIFALADRRNGRYTAKLTVTTGLAVSPADPDAPIRMSDFSSWGSTGALAIKPELTAPGGEIYSVNGADRSGAAYELMGGTSMATPHVSGLTALAMQYFADRGVLDRPGVTLGRRALAQSLLMSTAVPILEETDGGQPVAHPVEYSVRNQGAGLVNLENMVKAETYLTVAGQTDGKVKAELGDELRFLSPNDRAWRFTFTAHNLTDRDQTYDLSASVLTTGTTYQPTRSEEDGDRTVALATDRMVPLAARVTYAGSRVSGSALTVPAGGSADVTVTLRVTDEAVALQTAKGYTNGFYVEGFVYLNASGATAVTHSIPLLGWYGSWTGPSMYDKGSYLDYFHRFTIQEAAGSAGDPVYEVGMNWPDQVSHVDYTTANAMSGSYLWLSNMFSITPVGSDRAVYYSGNPYNEFATHESQYLPDRNACNSTADRPWQFYAIFPSLIRNATALRVRAYDADTGAVYREDSWDEAGFVGTFFYNNEPVDVTTAYGFGFSAEDPWSCTDAQGAPLAEGTRVTWELTMLPEYYRHLTAGPDGARSAVYDWDSAGPGASLSLTFTVDNTAPQLLDARMTGENTLAYRVRDERYVAAVVLLDGAGTSPIRYYYPDQTQPGAVSEGTVDLTGVPDRKITLAVCDYAGNESYYVVNRGGEGASYGQLLAFQQDIMDGYYHNWVAFDPGCAMTETTVFSSAGRDFACAEYAAGWVFAQTQDGSLYAIDAREFTSTQRQPDLIFLAKLRQVYQDLAYNYADGRLYGLYNTADDGVGVRGILLSPGESPEDPGVQLPAFSEVEVGLTNFTLTGYAMAIDDQGSVYLMAEDKNEGVTDEERATGDKADPTAPSIDANFLSLYKADMGRSALEGYYGSFRKVAEPKISSNYRQSMTFDHNTETLYWASFDRVRLLRSDAFVYAVTLPGGAAPKAPAKLDSLRNPAQVTSGGYTFTWAASLGTETYCLMAPLGAQAAASAAHAKVPPISGAYRDEPGTPVLSAVNLALIPGDSQQLTCRMDPWFTRHTQVSWSSDDQDVCTVDSTGRITAHAAGSAVVTAASLADPARTARCAVVVAEAQVHLEGVISASSLYSYDVRGADAQFTVGRRLDFTGLGDNYGQFIGATVLGRDGDLFGVDCDDTGVLYRFDPATGEALDWYQPINGDFLFDLAYSPSTDVFTGVMGSYLYGDIPLTQDDRSYEKEIVAAMAAGKLWHSIDLADWLLASNTQHFTTGEVGFGSRTDVVISALTNLEGAGPQVLTHDFLGAKASASYTPATTWVLLDNLGRFWYVDEITGMTRSGNAYVKAGMTVPADMLGVHAFEAGGTHSVFVVRSLQETPLYDMYLVGALPKITYHYNGLYHTTVEAPFTDRSGARSTVTRDVYFLSLNQTWWLSYLKGEMDATNYLYLYVPGLPTGVGDGRTPDLLLPLGQTPQGRYVASIHAAQLKGGVDLSVDLERYFASGNVVGPLRLTGQGDDLVTNYTVTAAPSSTEPGVTDVTVTGDDLRRHSNGTAEGYWLGYSVTAPAGANGYRCGFGATAAVAADQVHAQLDQDVDGLGSRGAAVCYDLATLPVERPYFALQWTADGAPLGGTAVYRVGFAVTRAGLDLPTPLTALTISGVPQMGQALTAQATPAAATADYQWLRASGGKEAPIPGATDRTYVLTAADLGCTLKVTATGTGRFTGTLTSDPTAVVTEPPRAFSYVRIETEPAVVGQTLTAQVTPAAVQPPLQPVPVTADYQWYTVSGSRNGAAQAIPGATGSTYTPTRSDIGKWLRVEVTGTGRYAGSAVSSTTLKAVVSDQTNVRVTVTGLGAGVDYADFIRVDVAARMGEGNLHRGTEKGIDAAMGETVIITTAIRNDQLFLYEVDAIRVTGATDAQITANASTNLWGRYPVLGKVATFTKGAEDVTVTVVLKKSVATDDPVLMDALRLVQHTDYTAFDSTLTTAEAARAAVAAFAGEKLADPRFADVSVAVNTVSFQPLDPDPAADPDGAPGQYVFTFTLTKGADQETTQEIILRIFPTPPEEEDDTRLIATPDHLSLAVGEKGIVTVTIPGALQDAAEAGLTATPDDPNVVSASIRLGSADPGTGTLPATLTLTGLKAGSATVTVRVETYSVAITVTVTGGGTLAPSPVWARL